MKYKPPKHHRIKVKERGLGYHEGKKVLGQVDLPPFRKTVKIDIERRRNGLVKLDVLCHELIHLFDPDMKEGNVRRMATYIAKGLWRENYRKVK